MYFLINNCHVVKYLKSPFSLVSNQYNTVIELYFHTAKKFEHMLQREERERVCVCVCVTRGERESTHWKANGYFVCIAVFTCMYVMWFLGYTSFQVNFNHQVVSYSEAPNLHSTTSRKRISAKENLKLRSSITHS